MRSAMFASATAHAVVVAVVYFGLPKWFEPEELIEETPIVVELVEIAERTVAAPVMPVVEPPKADVPPAPAPAPVAQAAPPPPPVAEPPPPPPPAAEPPPPEPTPQVAALEPPPAPVARPTPPAPTPAPVPTVQAPPKPAAKPAPPKVVATPKPQTKPEPPKQQPAFDPTAIAALLDRTRQPVTPPAPTPPQVQPKAATPTPPQQQAAPAPVMTPTPQPARDVPMTLSETDAFRAAVERCWSIPAGARDAQNLRVTLRLFLTQDGNLLRPPEVVDAARMNRAGEETFRAAAESALRAIQRCAPYRMLPAQKYDTWREIELTFDPSKVLAG